MKNFIQNLVPSKLTYKLACLFMVAMFAGSAQATLISTFESDTLMGGLYAGKKIMGSITSTGPFSSNSLTNAETDPEYALSMEITGGGPSLTDLTADIDVAVLQTDINSVIGHFFFLLKYTSATTGWFLVNGDLNLDIQNFIASSLTDIELSVPSLGYISGYYSFAGNNFGGTNITPISTTNYGGTNNIQVPEPTSLLLLLTGMFGVTAAKRRNKGMMAAAA